jgi:hypothetical protein
MQIQRGMFVDAHASEGYVFRVSQQAMMFELAHFAIRMSHDRMSRNCWVRPPDTSTALLTTMLVAPTRASMATGSGAAWRGASSACS